MPSKADRRRSNYGKIQAAMCGMLGHETQTHQVGRFGCLKPKSHYFTTKNDAINYLTHYNFNIIYQIV